MATLTEAGNKVLDALFVERGIDLHSPEHTAALEKVTPHIERLNALKRDTSGKIYSVLDTKTLAALLDRLCIEGSNKKANEDPWEHELRLELREEKKNPSKVEPAQPEQAKIETMAGQSGQGTKTSRKKHP